MLEVMNILNIPTRSFHILHTHENISVPQNMYKYYVPVIFLLKNQQAQYNKGYLKTIQKLFV